MNIYMMLINHKYNKKKYNNKIYNILMINNKYGKQHI
jgi:hypothetical protein